MKESFTAKFTTTGLHSMWNFCWSDASGRETWITTNDFTQFVNECETASNRHDSKFVCAGHALPLGLPDEQVQEAQEIIEAVIRCWESTKTMLNN